MKAYSLELKQLEYETKSITAPWDIKKLRRLEEIEKRVNEIVDDVIKITDEQKRKTGERGNSSNQ